MTVQDSYGDEWILDVIHTFCKYKSCLLRLMGVRLSLRLVQAGLRYVWDTWNYGLDKIIRSCTYFAPIKSPKSGHGPNYYVEKLPSRILRALISDINNALYLSPSPPRKTRALVVPPGAETPTQIYKAWVSSRPVPSKHHGLFIMFTPNIVYHYNCERSPICQEPFISLP